MCGRFILLEPERIIQRYAIQEKPAFSVTARYNIAPGQLVPIVIRENPIRLELMKWGLIPFWAKDPAIGYQMINARAETIAEKPSFKSALQSKRCLVPASGFYEWKEINGQKMPYLIKLKEVSLFSFAGLYDIWLDESKQEIKTFTIITTAANAFIASIHNRMPVILRPSDEEVWIDVAHKDTSRLLSLLKPYPDEAMEMYPVSTAVNNPKNDSPELIQPISSHIMDS
ncbi:MAG: SOS response-associated peptidase [bacterium]|nr:SOS response-associated peptidase [bacterium]